MQAFQKFIRVDEIKRAKDIDRQVNCCNCFFYDFLEVEYVIKLIKFSSYVKPLSGETPGDFAAPAPAPKQAFSGRYESWYWFGNALELRVDIDVRAQNSPVMNCVSGDIYHSNKYSRSWICTNPTINISNSKAEITGNVTYWIPQSIIVDKTTMHITIPRSNTGKVGPAVVTLNNVFPGTSSSYICEKKSHCFRSIAVEVDVTTLVYKPPDSLISYKKASLALVYPSCSPFQLANSGLSFKGEKGTVEVNSKIDLKATLKPYVEFTIEINNGTRSFLIRFTFQIETRAYVTKLKFTKNADGGKSIDIEKIGINIELFLLQIEFSDFDPSSSDTSLDMKMKLGGKSFEIHNLSLYARSTDNIKDTITCLKCNTINSAESKTCIHCSSTLNQ